MNTTTTELKNLGLPKILPASMDVISTETKKFDMLNIYDKCGSTEYYFRRGALASECKVDLRSPLSSYVEPTHPSIVYNWSYTVRSSNWWLELLWLVSYIILFGITIYSEFYYVAIALSMVFVIGLLILQVCVHIRRGHFLADQVVLNSLVSNVLMSGDFNDVVIRIRDYRRRLAMICDNSTNSCSSLATVLRAENEVRLVKHMLHAAYQEYADIDTHF